MNVFVYGFDADFIEHATDLPDERVDRRRYHERGFQEENDEDVEDLERRIQERFSRHHEEYDEEATEVDQQALLPSVRDPKLWMVKCAVRVLRWKLEVLLLLLLCFLMFCVCGAWN